MAKIERFEDLKCWQESRILVKAVYTLCDRSLLAKDFDTKSQLKRAALSVMNNIAEGFGRYSNKEFVRFLDIASSSAAEVKSILYVVLDLGYTSREEVEIIQSKAEEVKALCLGMIKYLIKKT